jgi:hypothetical protein
LAAQLASPRRAFAKISVIMLRFAIPVFFAAALFAQNPDNPFENPPPGVDEALRERMKEFYQDHVTGQFRKAESLVAEETRDWFYEHNKPKYLSFEITEIRYSENFTKARATVLCEQIVPFPGFAGRPMKVPTRSDWKLVDGKWYWYIPPEVFKSFPFPTIPHEGNGAKPAAPAQPAPGAGAAVAPPSLSSIPTSPDFILKKVTPDRDKVELKANGSGTVTFHNSAPGSMSIEVASPLKGVTVTPERASLDAGKDATLTFKAAEDAKGGTVQVRIEPTGEVVEIKVSVK